MTSAQFASQVQSALDRVAALRRTAQGADGPLVRAVLAEALEELSLSFEELNVAQEELRAQNEALLATEAAAAAERDRYRDLFEFAPCGYLVTDAEGVILETNRAARELLNLAGPRFLTGKPLSVFVSEPDRPALLRQLTDLQNGKPAWNRALAFQPRPEGSAPRVVDVTVVPFRDLETRKPRLRWQLRDVTDRHRAAEELRRANESLEERVRVRTAELDRLLRENEELVAQLREQDRRKDEFLATLAHELRNPLAPLRNAVEILNLAGVNAPAVDQARGLIDRQVFKLVRLIDDLLDVTRIARGKVQLLTERIDLADAARTAAESLRPAARERAVKLHDETGGPVPVRADPARLEQVLTNLITNAIKYTDRGGGVTVGVGAAAGFGVVRVRDTGVGIAPEVLPHIFELFVQAERSIGRSQGGLGIGLHLVKQLVELHGGTVSAHSDGVGRGSEFAVRLPLDNPPGAGA